MKISIEDVARVCYEANRAYCMVLGDHSHSTWDTAPSWQKDGTVKGIRAVLENPELTPEASHESWLKEKKAAGWKYGPFKAPDMKEHPCMLPYKDLPECQRAKDVLFLSVVKSLISVMPAGLQPVAETRQPDDPKEHKKEAKRAAKKKA